MGGTGKGGPNAAAQRLFLIPAGMGQAPRVGSVTRGQSSVGYAELQRLVLIRYQLLQAERQALQPPPLDSLAVGTVHDAVESMLWLVCGHDRLSVRGTADFMTLFDAVTKGHSEGSSLAGLRSRTDSLNSARVNLKHKGNLAGSATITQHLQTGDLIVSMLCQSAFQLEIRTVSLHLLVQDDEARTHLAESVRHWEAGNAEEALQRLRLAFDRLIKDFEERKTWYSGRSMFSTRPPLSFRMRTILSRSNDPLDEAFKWLESIDSWVKILALGVDTRSYAFFRVHTPNPIYQPNGEARFEASQVSKVSGDTYYRCLEFVAKTALAFAGDDFDFDGWALANRTTTGSIGD